MTCWLFSSQWNSWFDLMRCLCGQRRVSSEACQSLQIGHFNFYFSSCSIKTIPNTTPERRNFSFGCSCSTSSFSSASPVSGLSYYLQVPQVLPDDVPWIMGSVKLNFNNHYHLWTSTTQVEFCSQSKFITTLVFHVLHKCYVLLFSSVGFCCVNVSIWFFSTCFFDSIKPR